MSNFTSFSLFLFIICFASCVNRIDIPDDEESMLYIKLEILKGQNEITADFKTTNNLNGTYPIEYPKNGKIVIKQFLPDTDVNNEIELLYDEDLNKYVSDHEVNRSFLSFGKKFNLEASVEGSTLPDVSSSSVVPNPIGISDFELINEETVFDDDGFEYWQGTLGLTLLPSNTVEDNFGHLQIYGFRTLLEVDSNGDSTYIYGEEKKSFDLVDVLKGYEAVTDIIHKEGFFIEFNRLENNYIEIVLKSNFPITEDNQVTDMLNTDLMAVGKEHFDYHLAYHNIQKSQGNIFEENVLYNSNIEHGLGLFSTCVNFSKMLELR